MYSAMLAKQQSRLVVRLFQKQQIRILWVTFKNITNGTNILNIKNCKETAIKTCQWNPFHLGACMKLRLYSDNVTQLNTNEDTSKLSIAEDNSLISMEKVVKATQNFNLKQILYTKEDDIMRQLNGAENAVQLKNILEAEEGKLQKEHIVQSIILQWIFSKQNSSTRSLNKFEEQKFVQYILPLLRNYVNNLNMDELSVCYLYLRKLGAEAGEPVLEDILLNALDEVGRTKGVIGLPALSRLAVGIKTGHNFFAPLVCAKFMRHIKYHIDSCKTEADIRGIAKCLYSLHTMVNTEMMDMYEKKVYAFIESGEISNATPKTIVKILKVLNMPVWSHKHSILIKNLLVMMKSSIKELDANDLKDICRIYQYHMEPVSLHEPLAGAMEELLNKQMTAENLAFFVPFAPTHRRESLINDFTNFLSSAECWQSPNSSGYLFSILRGLKISDTKICNTYWSGVREKLAEEKDLEFLGHCHRYMNFNNNLGGTYRHMALEKNLCQLCMKAIIKDIQGRIPKTFARLASFVLAYGHTPNSWKKYPNILLSKIITMGEQFTPTDCYLISRGLQTSLEMRYRSRIPQLIRMQISSIDNILIGCIEKHLNNKELTVTDLNMLVRTLVNQKSLRNTVVYHKALQKYKEVPYEDLNSRVIKDVAFNFMATNYMVPEIFDKMFSYIEENRDRVSGSIVEKVLTCSYNLGYTPQNYEALHYAGDILIRDFNNLSGLALIQASLALCFYKTMPEELISKVFCAKFIQQIEEEIQVCYSKTSYPEHVLNMIMQLNRSVCLDFPEANVPWFQQNFIEAQLCKKPASESNFSREVKEALTALLKNESYIRCNHVTPYGYQIDFLINFNKNKKPIDSSAETTMLDRITKVAILLLKLDSFCENDLNSLKGPDSMKIKHLEMMGYKVLHINEHDWNTKYLNASKDKKKYLQLLLQISN